MTQTNKNDYEIYEEFDNNSATLYHKKDTSEEYLVVPVDCLNQAYGYYFIDRDLLLRDDWADDVLNALVKDSDALSHLDDSASEQDYLQLLKVDPDNILPTIANVEHRTPLKVATEEFSMSSKMPKKINDEGEPSYVFDY